MIPKISKTIVGCRIVKVVSGESQDNGDRKGDGNTLKDLYVPSREAYLKLDNGLILKCWNSEWGGIHVLDPTDNSDATEIDFVNKGAVPQNRTIPFLLLKHKYSDCLTSVTSTLY